MNCLLCDLSDRRPLPILASGAVKLLHSTFIFLMDSPEEQGNDEAMLSLLLLAGVVQEQHFNYKLHRALRFREVGAS